MSELCNPYESDDKFLNKLGLSLWESKTNEELFLGEVFPYKIEKGRTLSIKIWVTCMPAQFYRFIVHNIDENIFYEITTGSGTLAKYYPMASSVDEVIND